MYGDAISEEMLRKKREVQREKRWKGIKRSKYNT